MLSIITYCPHSSMDRMRACGVCDVGSIPTEGTKCEKQTNYFVCGHFVMRSYVFSVEKTSEQGSRPRRVTTSREL